MKTVILFGAGASKCAGYPSAMALLPEIERYAQNPRFGELASPWSIWTDFLKAERDSPLGWLLGVSNPEIILSVLDLYFPALINYSNEFGHSILVKDGERYDASLQRMTDPRAKSAQTARNALLGCLAIFFRHKSWDEFHPAKRDYLRQIFSELHDSDTIITFNWDMTAERTLGEMGLWNPTTGYGFNKKLFRTPAQLLNGTGPGYVPVQPDKDYMSVDETRSPELLPTAIQVLKLHGSTGWMRDPDDLKQKIYFHNDSFFQHLRIVLPDKQESVVFRDPDFKLNLGTDFTPRPYPVYRPMIHDEPVFVAPTFIKSVPAGEDMQRIWFQAGKALAEADRVLVWGYSLPASDSAARVLLNPLRFRLAEKDVEVIVRDPLKETRDRWDEFLGQSVSRNERLGEC